MMLRWKPVTLVALLGMVCCANDGACAAEDATFKVGVTSRHVLPPGPYNWRGAGMHALAEVVWYPADNNAAPKPQLIPPVGEALFEAGPAAPEARLAASPAKFPLILLSHGTGGTAQSMAWFATALASRGYIVAAVNHPGNTAMEPYTVEGFTLWWLRAKDITMILDDILGDPDFGSRIDTNRIGAAGFSLGGYTTMELAGGRTARDRFADACKATPDQVTCKPPPEFPDLVGKAESLAKVDPTYAQALHDSGASYRDERIRAVFAMAPALGPAFPPESLHAIKLPVTIVAGESDSIVPTEASAKYYAANISGAGLTIFPGAVDHYVFVDTCTDAGHKAAPPICDDKPGVDRETIHNQTVDIAAKFFASHL